MLWNLDESAALVAKGEALSAFRETEQAWREANAFISLAEGPEWSEGPLAGVPIAIKDNFVTRDLPTTCASKMLERYCSPFEATVVERLRRAGACIVGKANLDEFAMGSSNEHSHYGAASNPWDLSRVPGGSSGGSAVAVAAGMVPVALGSDTGGSVRQPAAFCGVLGFKPTYGRLSRYGLIAFGSSLDCPGIFAREVKDLRQVYHTIAGHDPRDATSATAEVEEREPSAGIAGTKLGVLRGLSGLSPDVERVYRETQQRFEEAGARCVDVELQHHDLAIPTYYVLSAAEASSNLSRFDGVRFGHRASGDFSSVEAMMVQSRSEGFGAEVRRRIMLGTFVLASGYYDAYYDKAQRVRTLIQRAYARAFDVCDAILIPTTPDVAFVKGTHDGDPVKMYLQDVLTVGASLAGLPALSFPAGVSQEDLPIGMQLIAPAWQEQRIFTLSEAFQEESDHHLRRPPRPQGVAA